MKRYRRVAFPMGSYGAKTLKYTVSFGTNLGIVVWTKLLLTTAFQMTLLPLKVVGNPSRSGEAEAACVYKAAERSLGEDSAVGKLKVRVMQYCIVSTSFDHIICGGVWNNLLWNRITTVAVVTALLATGIISLMGSTW